GAKNTTFFYRPLSLTANNPPYDVLIGKSAAFGWFAIKMDCANLILKTPPRPVVRDVTCDNLSLRRASGVYTATIKSTKKNATITVYTLEVDGKVVKQKKSSSTSTELTFKENAPGEHNVRASVQSSIGSKTSSDCTAQFNNATPPPPTPPPPPKPPVAV